MTDLDGTGITPEGWLFSFEKTGIYTVRYDLIDADGAGIATAESVITVKLPSTQGSVAENFNQGAFDADVFEASETGDAVKDQALYFKTATGARFVTKGNSESFILTVDLVSVAGEGAFGFVFGMTGITPIVCCFHRIQQRSSARTAASARRLFKPTFTRWRRAARRSPFA